MKQEISQGSKAEGPAIEAYIELEKNAIVKVSLHATSHPGTSWKIFSDENNFDLVSLIGNWFDCYVQKRGFSASLPLQLPDFSEWTAMVINYLSSIPQGSVMTYGQLASLLGRPKASRSVGTACGKNPVPLFVPCHRIISRCGLGGYSGGSIEIKQRLLAHEM